MDRRHQIFKKAAREVVKIKYLGFLGKLKDALYFSVVRNSFGSPRLTERNMNEIISKLEKLESIFIKANAPVLRRFNPGLQDHEISAFFSENNIPFHRDLFSLYNWHNGLTSIYGELACFTELSPLGSFPNLIEMLALRNDFMSYDYFEVENRDEYVPFLSGGEDDMHLLRISTGEIYWSSPAIQVFCEPRFYSLSSMLDFIINCYEKNVLTMHADEGLIVDEKYWKLKDDYND